MAKFCLESVKKAYGKKRKNLIVYVHAAIEIDSAFKLNFQKLLVLKRFDISYGNVYKTAIFETVFEQWNLALKKQQPQFFDGARGC